MIEAALRARIPYLDVAAEIEANADTFEQFAAPAREAGIVIVPAMAFDGGLGDLLATVAAMGEWHAADEICIAYGLDSWRPTPGTRAAGRVSKARRDPPRLRVPPRDRPEQHAESARVVVRLLDGFDLSSDGESVPLPLASQRLVAYLALHGRLLLRLHVAGMLLSPIGAHTSFRNVAVRMTGRRARPRASPPSPSG